MDGARRLLRGLWLLEATICVLAFAITSIALMADVLGREFFGNGIFGAQRLAVWTTAIAGLVGFALVTAEAGHLRPRFLALQSATLFSATLSPPDYAMQLLGLPENTAWKSLPASSLNSLLSSAEGALKPEFDVSDVNASLRPFRSSSLVMPLPG